MHQPGEPSVEEILDSIKKVIARDNREGAIAQRRERSQSAARPSAARSEPIEPVDAEEAEEVLELDEDAMVAGAGRDEDEVKQIEANTPKTLPRTKGNYVEWVNAAIGDGHKPLSRFENAGPITEMVLLGNLAIRAGEPVQWAAKELRSPSREKATRYVRREYRQGWKLS